MVRTPCSDKSSGLRKGTWTPEEDRKLVAYVTRYGCWNWRLLPKFAGLARCGKSCRLRWMNYLRPDIKRGDYSEEEEETIIRLHQKLGNRWSMIAANLPGRTDNEIKNHWHTALKKRSHDNTTNSDSSPNTSAIGTKTSKGKASKSKKNHSPILKEANNNHKEIMERDLSEISSNNNNITGPIMMSPQPSSSVTAETATNNEAAAAATIMINQQQQHEENNNNNNNLFVVQELDDDDLAYFLDAYKEPPVSADFWTEPYLTDVSYVAPPTEFLFDAAPVPLMHQPHHDDHEYYFSPIWDVDYFWGQNNNTTTTFYHQECGGLFY